MPYNRRPPRGDNAWKVIPNLAIEVVSRSNTADEIVGKIHEYFQSGVELVWVVYPEHGEIYVYESPTKVHVLARNEIKSYDDLRGKKVNPNNVNKPLNWKVNMETKDFGACQP